MHRQEFEKHPKLAESLMLMAGTQTAMTLTEWNAFIENLCAALVDGDAALKAERDRLRRTVRVAATGFDTIRGAVESNQVVDKDVHGLAVSRRDACLAALGEDQ